jgi:ssDNA-binding Zn-finger/Zn-ribbon topoisomerase 1
MNGFYSDENCRKLRFQKWPDAVEQATHDEMLYGDKRKVYFCWNCKSWHTSRETVNTDVGLLAR